MRALKEAFKLNQNSDRVLRELAQLGFLFIDSIPFSMEYKGKRRARHYNILVETAAYTFMLKKLSAIPLWSPNVHVAFSVRNNANAIIKCLNNRLRFNDVDISISDNQIATNAANYPCAKKLRRIFNMLM